MVNQAQPPDPQAALQKPFQLPGAPPTMPPLRYFLGRMALEGYSPAARSRLIQRFADRKAKLWQVVWTAAMDSLGLKSAPPADRLLFYLRMSALYPDRWTEWQLKIPTGKYGFEKHWQDYQELRIRAIRGDFGPVLALAAITGRLPPSLLPPPPTPVLPPAAAVPPSGPGEPASPGP